MSFSGIPALTLVAVVGIAAMPGRAPAGPVAAPVSASASAIVVVADSPATNPKLAAGLGLSVYPSKDQSKEQQAKDEQECYQWAGEQTGIDPTVQMNVDS
ncbi:MAG TPA: hypothetical protein VJQ44_16255, partial [Gemmatimonadales bacterium]|nr:hypothetical protein [Gemmatimonadales bacterium]